MSTRAEPPGEVVSSDALAVLSSLREMDLGRYEIVGNYLRYDDRARHTLKDLKQRILLAFQSQSRMPANFLIWGFPGSGKSYLIQQIAAALDETVQYRELNLARLDERALASELQATASLPGPVLCLLDEVDSNPNEAWPYERLLPYLEPPSPPTHRICYCLAGSGGESLPAMREHIRSRPKGSDLLSRIPVGNDVSVPALGPGDKVLVAAVQLLNAAREEGRELREIERLALYYIAVTPTLGSARQLRHFAGQAAQRLPIGEDRLRYDDLFRAGDPENKLFWERSADVRARLGDAFVHLVARPNPAPWVAPRPPAGGAVPPPAGVDLGVERLVVLPFVNISPDPNDEYFADGMTEELIEKLANIGGLRVIARTTAMHYKHRRETALDIGRTLHVGKVVECSVRKAGNRIRITAQLIDTSTEEHLWATRYDRELDDVFAIQDDLAGQIARAVSARLAVPERAAVAPRGPASTETLDLSAYTLYLQGRQLLRAKASEESVARARTLFEEAIARDAQFARARVGRAEALLYLGGEGAIPFAPALGQARQELEAAIAQDGSIAEAHSVLAGLLLGEDELGASEREARRAIELNPSLSDAYRWLAQLAATRRSMEEAVQWLEAARQIDPANIDILAFLGRGYAYCGRDADAEAHWARTKSVVEYRTNAHETEYYLGRGELARANATLGELERLRPQSPWTLTYRAIYAARTGAPDRAREILERLREREQHGELMVLFIGMVEHALGEREAFVRSMERAFEMHSLPLMELKYSRLYEDVRGDPRILALLRKQAELQ